MRTHGERVNVMLEVSLALQSTLRLHYRIDVPRVTGCFRRRNNAAQYHISARRSIQIFTSMYIICVSCRCINSPRYVDGLGNNALIVSCVSSADIPPDLPCSVQSVQKLGRHCVAAPDLVECMGRAR